MTGFHCLLMSAALAWLMLVVASMLRTGGATPDGLRLAFGNRDDIPPPSVVAERADRAAKNMLENLVLFACVLLAAQALGAAPDRVLLGSQIFLGARVVYFVLYLAGIKYVRTLMWAIALVGIALIAIAAW